jgi:hypothetical protein
MSKLLFCKQCNVRQLVSDKEIYCESCGILLIECLKCPNCNEEIGGLQNYCKVCGIKLR